MRTQFAFGIVATAAWAVALVCPPVRAAAEDCSAIAVDVDAPVVSASPELPARVRRSLAQREGLDRCARVRLREGRPSIVVEVSLADGRTASRAVAEADDVLPVLEALLTLPDGAERARSESVASERNAPFAPRAFAPPSAARDELAGPESEWHAPVNFELSAFTNARAGSAAYGAGYGAFAMLDVAGFLLAAGGRVDHYTQQESAPQSTLRVVGLGGRRFRLGATSLDVLVGPAFTLESEATERVGANGDVTITEPDALPRLLLASHLNFRARSLLRGFVGIESELRLGSAGTNVPNDRRLPAWMLGLALGGTVGTR